MPKYRLSDGHDFAQRNNPTATSMATIDDQKASARGHSRPQPEGTVEANEEAGPQSLGPVIELGDLTTGPEAEVSRLKSNMTMMLAEVNRIRSEHASLAADYQGLTLEFRDIKLVLAKVHAKELRAIERPGRWSQFTERLRAMFRSGPDPRKNQRSTPHTSSSIR